MTRMFNMSDPDDVSLARLLSEQRAATVKEMLANHDVRAVLEDLITDGYTPAEVHSAMAAIMRDRN